MTTALVFPYIVKFSGKKPCTSKLTFLLRYGFISHNTVTIVSYNFEGKFCHRLDIPDLVKFTMYHHK